jgi:uncharacterized protein (DUF2249 family)
VAADEVDNHGTITDNKWPKAKKRMFSITNRTRISEIVRSHPDSIHALASVAKPLEKLKNPLLRRMMAPRVTLAEAAAIGGCDLEQLRQVLIPLGFHFLDEIAEDQKQKIENKPHWLLAVPRDKIYDFDVRPLIDGGEDPLKAIIKKFNTLSDGEVLCIVNSFVPYPLIHLLARQSLTYTLEITTSEHHTWFLKRKQGTDFPAKKMTEGKLTMDDEQSFEMAVAVFDESSVKRIDVRQLAMPAPIQIILSELADLQSNKALYVYHKKVPVYLFEALNSEHYHVHILNLREGEVRLLIYATGSF